ncbi:hypothetical protein AURDEDRAFT_111189 [Auricularia subglabra TFB-10046 SS5]|nr:hypothetical protein AURDEDRAFT_111189 [Auricularia subglabra TFB-10046 SS5]
MRSRHRPYALLASLAVAGPSGALAALPSVDFDRMGKVGLTGAFAGLDLLDQSAAPFAGVPLDPSSSTLFSRGPDGGLTRLGSTNSGGAIAAGCRLDDTFYFAGSFDSFQGTSAKNVASYTISSGVFNALGGSGAGIDGPVDALYCDDNANQVWVGGSFKAPTTGATGFAGGVAIWSPKAKSWSAPPFGGLTGGGASVLSITPNPSSSSLLFAGSFIASFQGNGTQVEGVSNPAVPISSGATTFSSSLVPIPLANAEVSAEPHADDPAFNLPKNILCPKGPDGPDNTWLAGDGQGAQINVRNFKFLSSAGLRLGQTFVDGRGTKTFCATSLPDNTPLSLRYIDPSTGEEHTCLEVCPLVSDKNVPYQDFLFVDGPRENTGIQVTLRAFSGAGPGLHLLQLLSDGAFASAVPEENGESCFAPGASSVKVSGKWDTTEVPTDIAGTVQEVQTQNVRVGTPAADAPEVTWSVYVSAAGNYDIFLLVPGCTQMQDCGSRTSVKVTVSPGGGLPDHVETISQQVQKDTRQLVYSGPVVPSEPDFTVAVKMTLADQPAGSGQGGQYHLVADRVQFVLKSDINGGTGANGTISVPGKSQQSFGLFEWKTSSSDKPDDKGLLPNNTITDIDSAGFALTAALGTNAGSASVNSAVIHDSGKVFLGGRFTLADSGSNIVAVDGEKLVALANGGLDGAVASLAISDDKIFVGGAFSDTASTSGQGKFNNVVAYDVKGNTWQALGNGVEGAVTSLELSDDKLFVTGASGFAVWDTTKGAWVPSGGFVVGEMSLVTNDAKFIAGKAIRSSQFGADGFVMLSTGKNGLPVLKPLGVALDDVESAQTPAAPSRRSWFSSAILPTIFARQGPSTPAPLPALPPAPAPAVLAGAFWRNVSSNTELAIFGGNFSFPTAGGSSEGIALYDADKGTLTPLKGPSVTGTVLSLLVSGNLLFVGGEFSLEGTPANGFAIYDLAAQEWQTAIQALQPASGSPVIVRSITSIPTNDDVIVVAGSFASAGSLPCQGICSWNTQEKQWRMLGNGIKGEVSSITYAGPKLDTLLAGGSIILADNTASNVASFSVPNTTWSAVGGGQGIPGPVTALEVNNGNSSSVFAAGRSTDGASTFFIHFDGASWKTLSSTFSADSTVAQMAMVPLTDKHPQNEVIQQDRMLWIAGAMSSSSFGNASTVLYDGTTFYPYIATSSKDGGPGFVSSLFHSFKTFSFNQRKFLATGIVILISIAIAAGIVFLLALLGILWTLFARRDDNSNLGYPIDDDDSSSLHRPSSLLAHINEATRKTILGVDEDPFSGGEKVAAGAAAGAMAAHHAGSSEDEYQDDDGYRRAETPAAAFPEDANRPAHARYSFEGTGAGELPVAAGTQLIVLDDRDPAWWYVRDANTGQEGVVPAAYIF